MELVQLAADDVNSEFHGIEWAPTGLRIFLSVAGQRGETHCRDARQGGHDKVHGIAGRNGVVVQRCNK